MCKNRCIINGVGVNKIVGQFFKTIQLGMQKIIFIIALFPLSALFIQAQKQKTSANLDVIDVSFCDLTQKPERFYRDKIVRIKATYSFGFENSRLFCSDCLDENNPVWVDFEDKLCSNSKKIKDNKRYGVGRTLNVTFVGKYEYGGSFGHFGVFPAHFLVSCVEKKKKLVNYRLAPSKLPEKVLSKYLRQKDEVSLRRAKTCRISKSTTARDSGFGCSHLEGAPRRVSVSLIRLCNPSERKYICLFL